MTHIRTFAATVCLITLVSAEARAAKTGTVYVENHTSQSIHIVADSWLDNAGKTIVPTASWDVKPKTRVRLSYKGRGVYASKFTYRIKTSAGTTPTNPRLVVISGD